MQFGQRFILFFHCNSLLILAQFKQITSLFLKILFCSFALSFLFCFLSLDLLNSMYINLSVQKKPMRYRNTTQAIKVLLLTIIYLSFIMSLLKRLVSKVLSMVCSRYLSRLPVLVAPTRNCHMKGLCVGMSLSFLLTPL